MDTPSFGGLTLALELRSALNDAFPVMECRKALAGFEDDMVRAAEWLTDGGTLAGKLVSWNWEGLHKSVDILVAETGRSADGCLRVLKNCGGSLELARRKLTGQPLLSQSLPEAG